MFAKIVFRHYTYNYYSNYLILAFLLLCSLPNDITTHRAGAIRETSTKKDGNYQTERQIGI